MIKEYKKHIKKSVDRWSKNYNTLIDFIFCNGAHYIDPQRSIKGYSILKPLATIFVSSIPTRNFCIRINDASLNRFTSHWYTTTSSSISSDILATLHDSDWIRCNVSMFIPISKPDRKREAKQNLVQSLGLGYFQWSH